MHAASPLEKARIWLAVRLGWRIKGKMAEAIRGFQATEADGVWHLHRGMARMKDPKQRAIMFTHSLEEEAHAEAFAHAYSHYGERVLVPANYEREDLYPKSAPAWKIFAFVHVGEEDATERFRCIRDYLEDGVLKDSLGRVVEDELGHVDLTHRMLERMGATPGQIKSEVRRVRLTRLWEGWLRTGKRVVDNVATLLLSLAYYVAGLFLFRSARGRLAKRFVEYDNNHIKKLA